MEQKWSSEFDSKNFILTIRCNYVEKGVQKEKALIFYLNFDNVMRQLLAAMVEDITRNGNNKKNPA